MVYIRDFGSWIPPRIVTNSEIGEQIGAERAVRRTSRDSRVDDVDYPTDRGRSEQQGRRAAKHFDPLGGERVDRNRMVGAG